jgi:hypothetical protein
VGQSAQGLCYFMPGRLWEFHEMLWLSCWTLICLSGRFEVSSGSCGGRGGATFFSFIIIFFALMGFEFSVFAPALQHVSHRASQFAFSLFNRWGFAMTDI